MPLLKGTDQVLYEIYNKMAASPHQQHHNHLHVQDHAHDHDKSEKHDSDQKTSGPVESLITVAEKLNVEEAQAQADAFLTKIFREHGRLSSFVKRYEIKLRKKWKDLSAAKRKALLKTVNPELPSKRNEALHLYFEKNVRTAVISRVEALLPYLNVEDCCKEPSHILGLAHYRGRLPPEAFFNSDLLSLDPAASLGVVRDKHVLGFCMSIHGGEEGYGRFVQTDSAQDPLGTKYSSSSSALLVLEAQANLLEFLSEWVAKMVTPHEGDLTEEFPPEPPDVMTSSMRQNMNRGWISLAERNSLLPYMAPLGFSVDRMRRVILSMKGYSQDRMLLLRTDPEYFFHVLKSYDEHRPERIPSAQANKLHPELERPQYYDRLVGSIITECLSDVMFWPLVEVEFQKLQKLMQLMGEEDVDEEAGKENTRELLKAAEQLRVLTSDAFKSHLGAFGSAVKACPAFRSSYSRKNNKTGEPVDADLRNEDIDSLFGTERVLWLLNRLMDGDENPFVTSRYLDEIDLHVQEGHKGPSNLTPLLLDKISMLSSLNEILTNLAAFAPAGLVSVTAEEIQDLREGRWSDLLSVFNATNNAEHHPGKFATPFSRFSRVPGSPTMTKTRNRRGSRGSQDIEGPTKAEENLKAFWKAVKEAYNSELVSSLIDGRTQMQNIDVSAMVTPIPSKEETEEGNRDAENKENIPVKADTDGNPKPGRPSQGHGRKKSVHFAEKIQTVPKIKHEPADSHQTPPTPTLKQQFYHSFNDPLGFSPLSKRILSDRLYKVASRLFPVIVENDPKRDTGLVEWKDFINFMITLEFEVERKRGSAWQFSKQSGMLVTSLCFTPPESNKLSPMETRNIGKRLTRRLGLEMTHFSIG